ncbi:MAG: hypothetical protein ACOYVK_19285 [Bacillota bacterium]
MIFLQQHWLDILSSVVVLVLMLALYIKDKEETLKKIILALVVEAEKNLGSGTGELKYAKVVGRVYEVLPPLLKLFLTKNHLDQLIEEAVAYLKNYLAGGKNLLDYDHEYMDL